MHPLFLDLSIVFRMDFFTQDVDLSLDFIF